MQRVADFITKLDVRQDRLLMFARVAVGFGSLLMFGMYAKLGFLPFAGGVWDLGKYRYLTVDISTDFVRDEWIITRAGDILTYVLPLLITGALWRKTRIDRLLAIIGGLALLMPMRRANVFCVAVVVMLMAGYELRHKLKKLVWLTLISLVLYSTTQLIFLNIFESATDVNSVMTAASTGLPEVRDFGWVLYLLGDDRYYGVTLVQPFVPLPSFVSDWKQRNTMGVITTSLIGMGREHREAGGLRVTFAGEGYMNFGLPGALLLSLLLGVCVAWVEVILTRASKTLSVAGMYLGSSAFVWVCFWTYLGGTQAFGTIKFGAIIMIALIYLSRKTVPSGTVDLLPESA